MINVSIHAEKKTTAHNPKGASLYSNATYINRKKPKNLSKIESNLENDLIPIAESAIEDVLCMRPNILKKPAIPDSTRGSNTVPFPLSAVSFKIF
jgi:hypothetical protein